jgi:hypothetical protein
MEHSDKLSKSALLAISKENLQKPLYDYKMTDAQRENWIRWAEYVHKYKKTLHGRTPINLTPK